MQRFSINWRLSCRFVLSPKGNYRELTVNLFRNCNISAICVAITKLIYYEKKKNSLIRLCLLLVIKKNSLLEKIFFRDI